MQLQQRICTKLANVVLRSHDGFCAGGPHILHFLQSSSWAYIKRVHFLPRNAPAAAGPSVLGRAAAAYLIPLS